MSPDKVSASIKFSVISKIARGLSLSTQGPELLTRTKKLSMIITIDGPAGAGKSTVAKKLAGRLGFEFLDTGAMYRSVALALLRRGGADQIHTLPEWILPLDLRFEPGRSWIGEEEVTSLIRSHEVTSLVSLVAEHGKVREKLVGIQKEYGVGRSLVTEGRDQGSVVFPNALCKFFLVADVLERARRRLAELEAKGQSIELDILARQIAERDRRDATRAIGPMIPAADAIFVDSTGMGIDEVVGKMEYTIRNRMEMPR